jgi:hypothetical protein
MAAVQFHSHHGLHVHGAAAPDVAIGDRASEGVVRPALLVDGDNVGVRQEEQRAAAGAVAPDTRHDAAATGERLEDLRLEPGVSENRREVAGGDDLIAGRVHGPETQERAQVLDEFGAGWIADRTREIGDGASGGHSIPQLEALVTAIRMIGRASRSWPAY